MAGVRGLPLLTLLAALLTAGVLLATPRVAINDGYGYDGLQYAEMVRAFRGEPAAPVSSLAAYRPVAPGVVAWSGMDTRDGFRALNAVASFASLVLLGLLLRRKGVSDGLIAVALAWWAVLPAGIRFYVYDPVLTDALGTAILLALVLAAEARRTVAFAALLCVGALTREPLVALAPLLFFALRPRGAARALATTAAATVPALVALLLVRAFPSVAIGPQISLPGAGAVHVFVLINNVSGDAWRYAAALPIGMGVLLIGPSLAAAGRAVRSVPAAWAYLAGLTLVIAAVGGEDHDRYLLPLSVPLAVAMFASARAATIRWPIWALWTALHLVAVRAFVPLGTDAASFAGYLASGMDLATLAATTALSLAAIALAAVVAARAVRVSPGSTP